MSRRSGVMLCYPFDERRLKRWGCPGIPVLVQPKINGVRCRAKMQTMLTLRSSEDNKFTSVPHILEEINHLYKGTNYLPDGELYVHGWPLGDITSITSRTVNLHLDHEKMEYHIFDIVDATNMMWLRATGLEFLKEIIEAENLSHIKIVPTLVASSEQIMPCMEKWVDEGYEGIIVRNHNGYYAEKKSTDIMKIKKRKMMRATVIRCIEEESIHHVKKGTLGAVECLSEEGVKFKVGTGFTAHQRKVWWPYMLIGETIKVEYQELTPAGVPYAPSFKGIICD